MKSSQESKYCIVDENGNVLPNARIANRATGQVIPDDEPLMILRAKDKNATVAMNSYWAMCNNVEHSTSHGERSEGEKPPHSRASRGVKPLRSAARQGGAGHIPGMSTGVFA